MAAVGLRKTWTVIRSWRHCTWTFIGTFLLTSYSTIRLNVLEALAFKAIVHIDAPRSNFMLVM
jgi:hypothetical protein